MLSWSTSTSREHASQSVSSGFEPANSGRWIIASCNFPLWFGMAIGNRLASLLSTWTKSIPQNGAKVASPRRFQ